MAALALVATLAVLAILLLRPFGQPPGEKQALIVEGEVTGHEIQCPIHGARFDLKTGRNLSLPAVRPIRRYEVRVDGDSIQVNV